MLKSIVKTINASTRFIVGDLNPSLTARTHALDEVASIRHDLKKAKAYDVKADAELLQELDAIMGREGDNATALTMEQATALAEEADVEEEVVHPRTAEIANEIVSTLKDTTRNTAKRATAIRTLLEEVITLNGEDTETKALLAIKKDVKFLNAVSMNYAKHTH